MFAKIGGYAAAILGALVVVGEVGYVQYISGHTIQTSRVYDASATNPPVSVPLTEADMPLRVVITATGERNTRHRLGPPFADIYLTLGAQAEPQKLRLNYAPEEEIQYYGAAISTRSFALETPPLGDVPITASLGDYHQLKIHQVDATFRGGGRGLSFTTLALGGLSFLLGILAVARQRRSS
ncbi:MAG: hypothetical protein AAF700_08725 [Pseudomonadota bacterium]